MEIEGKLHIRLLREHGRVVDVDIQSSRPLQAVKIFQGKHIADVIKIIPQLYHVCGVAQASAAMTACEQAMLIPVNEATQSAREMLVWMETVREHLWRIMIDWAHKLDVDKDATSIKTLQQYLPQLRQALFVEGEGFRVGARVNVNPEAVLSIINRLDSMLEDTVFTVAPAQWLLAMCEHGPEKWLQDSNTLASRMFRYCSAVEAEDAFTIPSCLPVLDDAGLHQHLTNVDADEFIARPQWQGKSYETTVLCRQLHHPVVRSMVQTQGAGMQARIIARLVELAEIPGRLRDLMQHLCANDADDSVAVTGQVSGIGLGQVEAARGRLIHRLELTEGRVGNYQILAPTEWNFHPQGVAAQLLKNLSSTDVTTLKTQADFLINVIDPCVRYEMTVH